MSRSALVSVLLAVVINGGCAFLPETDWYHAGLAADTATVNDLTAFGKQLADMNAEERKVVCVDTRENLKQLESDINRLRLALIIELSPQCGTAKEGMDVLAPVVSATGGGPIKNFAEHHAAVLGLMAKQDRARRNLKTTLGKERKRLQETEEKLEAITSIEKQLSEREGSEGNGQSQ